MNRKRAYVNGIIILINALYFVYLELIGSTESDVLFMLQHGAVEWDAVVGRGEYFRLLTAVFMHFGIGHIINNMLILFVLGGTLERAMGHLKYLVLYLVCGMGANLASLYFPVWLEGIASSYPAMAGILTGLFRIDAESHRYMVSAGASGAIFGVIGGLLYVVAVNKGRLEDLSSRQLAVVILFSLYLGFTSAQVDNAAHVSGLAVGIVMAAILYRRPRRMRRLLIDEDR